MFFADMDSELSWAMDPPDGTRVFYTAEADVPDHPAAPPPDFPEIGHDAGERSGYYSRAGRYEYPKWPLTAHAIQTFELVRLAESDPLRENLFDVARELSERAMASLLPAKDAPFFDLSFIKTVETVASDGRTLYPRVFDWDYFGPEIPYCGAIAKQLFRDLRARLKQGVLNSERSLEVPLERSSADDVEARRKSIERCSQRIATAKEYLQEVDRIEARTGRFGDLEEPDQRYRTAFMERLECRLGGPWREGGVSFDRALLNALLAVSQRSVMDPALAACVNEDLHHAAIGRLTPHLDHAKHVMFGSARTYTNATDADGVSLLVLDSDYGVNFMFSDCGVVEVWIDEKDLARPAVRQGVRKCGRRLTASGR